MIYLLWALLLVCQNAAFTWVSRARNSGSDLYHGIAAVFSNGIWFAATFITFERVWTVLREGNVGLGIFIGLVYVTATVTGSVLMGKVLRKYVETGKRRVGHYDEKEEKIKQLFDLAAGQRHSLDYVLKRVETAAGTDHDASVTLLNDIVAELRSDADDSLKMMNHLEEGMERLDSKVKTLATIVAGDLQRRADEEVGVVSRLDMAPAAPDASEGPTCPVCDNHGPDPSILHPPWCLVGR